MTRTLLPRITLAALFALVHAAGAAEAKSPGDYFFARHTLYTSNPSDGGGSVIYIDVADIDNDGVDDVILIDHDGPGVHDETLRVLLNDGAGGLSVAAGYPVVEAVNAINVADFNNDGDRDVFVAGRTHPLGYWVFQGNGDGTLGTGVRTTYPNWEDGPAWITTASDLNNDGSADIVGHSIHDDRVMVMLADGAGGFATPAFHTLVRPTISLRTADLNHDGNEDFVALTRHRASVVVFMGDGAGGFTQLPGWTPPDEFSNNSRRIELVDVNDDDELDVVVVFDGRRPGVGFSAPLIDIYLGVGDGTFEEEAAFKDYAENQVSYLAVEDVDADGELEVVFDTSFRIVVRALNDNAGNIPFEAYVSDDERAAAIRHVDDFDHDGVIDYLGTSTEGGLGRVVHFVSNPPDFNGDGAVGVDDLAVLLAGWGLSAADFNADGVTDTVDLAGLLALWGPCP